MRTLLVLLFLIFLHCSEKESKNKEIIDKKEDELSEKENKSKENINPAFEDPRGKPYRLTGYEIKYNEYIYYFKYSPDNQAKDQINNHGQEMLVFFPFVDDFRKDLLKNDPKEIVKHFNLNRKQKLLKYLKDRCLNLGINDLTIERLSKLYNQNRLDLKSITEYFYDGLTKRKAPLIINTLTSRSTREELYIVMIAAEYPLDYTSKVFFFKKNSDGKFEMDGYGALDGSYSREYYDSSDLARDDFPDGSGHKLLPSYKPACFDGLQRK